MQRLAQEADGYSPADLEALLDRTVHAAAQRTLGTATTISPGVSWSISGYDSDAGSANCNMHVSVTQLSTALLHTKVKPLHNVCIPGFVASDMWQASMQVLLCMSDLTDQCLTTLEVACPTSMAGVHQRAAQVTPRVTQHAAMPLSA